MYLIEILLPVYDNEGRPFGADAFDRVRNELANRFGGVTAFQRAPAEGVWKETGGGVSRDQIVIFEVMAEKLERAWWADFRRELERRFRQDEIVVRATSFERL
ncbi:MAG TPA: hypothetical protein VGV38_15030 [Pyrinomonadaceae bacterium]|nr:hypothetical protein [Pyrinomonadaceae bacterium]